MRKLILLLWGIVLFATSALAQRTIKGRVTDDSGNPVQNASVVVRGTTTGTTTDQGGSFSLSLPANARVIIVSSADMITQEIRILGEQSMYTVILKYDDKNLQEVVVIGYGTQQKRQVSAAIGKVNPEPISNLVTPSLDRQLAGRTPGLQVTTTSGLVNSTPRIRIRGVNSISGGRSPLIVLDGVPIETGGFSGVANTNMLSDINPADIESVEVLKDGSATAIFGSRAANGVLIITTKKGRSGRSNVTYSSIFGYSTPAKRFDLLNAQEFVTISNEKFAAASIPNQAFMNSENTNTDWQNYIFRTNAFSQTHNLSVDGGNDRSNYYFSVNYTDQEGLVITNKVRRYALRANLEHKINNWLKISNNLSISRTEDNDQNNGGNALSGAVTNALRALPNVRVFNPALPQFDFYNILPDGSALGQDANLRPIENNYTHIGFVLNKNKFNSTKHRLLNNLSLEAKPLKWLTFTSRFAIDYANGIDFQSLDPRHGDGRGSSGVVFNQNLYNLTWGAQNYINVTKNFGKHGLAVTAGLEFSKTKFSSFFGQGTVVSDIFFIQQNIISNSFGTQFSGGGYDEGPGLASYLARAYYDYNNRYFLGLTIRRDGLSRFAEEKRFGNFPGVSVGWRISEEKAWKQSNTLDFINEFKVRASWAKVGNDQIAGGLFPYLSQYGSRPYGAISGIAISLVGNAALQWETNEKFNVGVDLSLWRNRVNLTIDWFSNKNNDLVFAVPLPVSFGVPGNSIYQNIGNSQNKGFEISLSGNIIKKKDLNWDLSVNFTNSKNKVIKLPSGDIIDGYNIIREGEPINALFGYSFAGVNSANGNPMYYKSDGTLIQGNISNTTYYTVIKPDDPALGSQTTLASTDRILLGNVLPTWFGGASSTFSYKGFGFDMLWRFSGGNYIFNRTAQEGLYNQAFQNNGKVILDRWKAAGDITNVPRVWYGRDNFTNLQQNAVSRFVEKGDFLRLENIQFSYTLSPDILERITKGGIKSCKFFIQGQNIFLVTDYTGIDPENVTEAGQDLSTVPKPRIISFGFNIGL